MSVVFDKPPNYKGVGRPCGLTPEVSKTICDIISQGNYMVTAAQAVGIDRATLHDWIERGKVEQSAGDVDGLFSTFFNAVKEAEAASEIALVAEVRAHSKRNVVAPLAMLDRRFRERWGQTQTQSQAGNTYNINIEKAVIDAAGKFDAIMNRLAERTADPMALPAGDNPAVVEPETIDDNLA